MTKKNLLLAAFIMTISWSIAQERTARYFRGANDTFKIRKGDLMYYLVPGNMQQQIAFIDSVTIEGLISDSTFIPHLSVSWAGKKTSGLIIKRGAAAFIFLNGAASLRYTISNFGDDQFNSSPGRIAAASFTILLSAVCVHWTQKTIDRNRIKPVRGWDTIIEEEDEGSGPAILD